MLIFFLSGRGEGVQGPLHVEVVDDGGAGGPGGDAGGAAILADPPGDTPTVKPAPQEEPQVINLDSY